MWKSIRGTKATGHCTLYLHCITHFLSVWAFNRFERLPQAYYSSSIKAKKKVATSRLSISMKKILFFLFACTCVCVPPVLQSSSVFLPCQLLWFGQHGAECWVIDWSMGSLISQLNSNTLDRSTSLSYQAPHVSRWQGRGKRLKSIL